MIDQFLRTEMLLGKDKMERLYSAKVAVFGVGGVGGYAVEALARCGIGQLDLFDNDIIAPSNLNRQIHTNTKNIGEYKVDAAKASILEINPSATVVTYKLFYVPDTSSQVDLKLYDYVIDAIDTVSGKIELAVRAFECGVPIISSMGAGNKMEAALFEVADIYATSVCPLARVMRRELRKRDIPKLKVVYSKEPPLTPKADMQLEADMHTECAECKTNCALDTVDHACTSENFASTLKSHASITGTKSDVTRRRQIPGSTAFVPPVVGMIIAGEVVKALVGYNLHSDARHAN